MTEPVRLLEAPRSGLERDLLRSALGEVAPDAVRARVLQSVDAMSFDAVSFDAVSFDAVSFDAVSLHAVLGGSSLESSAVLPSAGARRGLALRSVPAMVLSGALALAAGAGVLLQSGAVRDWMRPAALPPSARFESLAGAPPETLLTPAPAALAALPAAQGPLANLSSELPQLHGNPSAPASRAEEVSAGQEADWLGAQLQLLGRVRELLESGQLEQAGSLLDGYERQFPGGLIRPQIQRLRAELRERRSSSSPPR